MSLQTWRNAASIVCAIGALGAVTALGCAAPSDEATVAEESAPAVTPAPAGFVFPEGDAAKGREVFVAMSCYSCHEVPGETFPAPVAQPPVPVPLTTAVTERTREQIAESILAPSHTIREGAEDAETPELSRMGDYTESLTVRQLIDLVTYLQSLSANA